MLDVSQPAFGNVERTSTVTTCCHMSHESQDLCPVFLGKSLYPSCNGHKVVTPSISILMINFFVPTLYISVITTNHTPSSVYPHFNTIRGITVEI
jgi:hypothetical protein